MDYSYTCQEITVTEYKTKNIITKHDISLQVWLILCSPV